MEHRDEDVNARLLARLQTFSAPMTDFFPHNLYISWCWRSHEVSPTLTIVWVLLKMSSIEMKIFYEGLRVRFSLLLISEIRLPLESLLNERFSCAD